MWSPSNRPRIALAICDAQRFDQRVDGVPVRQKRRIHGRRCGTCKIRDGLFSAKVDISQSYIANKGSGYTTGGFSGPDDREDLIVGRYSAVCGWIDELSSHRALVNAAKGRDFSTSNGVQ